MQHENRQQQESSGSINVARNERLLSLATGAAMAVGGVAKRGWAGAGLLLVGAPMLLRGITGRSYLYKRLGKNRAVVSDTAAVSVPHGQGIRVEKVTTINRPVSEVYAFWRNFGNLPRFMNNLERVDMIDQRRSHWVAKAPANQTVEWDAEIVNEIENEVIGWRTLNSKLVEHAGSVQFKSAPGGRGTEVRVVMEYAPLGGAAGSLVARLFGTAPEQQVDEDLRRLKQILETGDPITVEGQPSGRAKPEDHPTPSYVRAEEAPKDVVQQASEESFPASDPPAYY
ncbi:MAG: DUF2892 domain-containing protein [Chloroflexi bacterium]|nr:DUF2892 domain-containing protein [Chloroflexota bacterium]